MIGMTQLFPHPSTMRYHRDAAELGVPLQVISTRNLTKTRENRTPLVTYQMQGGGSGAQIRREIPMNDMICWILTLFSMFFLKQNKRG